MNRGQRKAWLSAALLSFGLLALPLALWLFLPHPAAPPPLPPRAAAPEEHAATPQPDEAPPPRRQPSAPEAVTAQASTAPVRGVVLAPDGNPMPGASVACDDPPGLSASTNEEGRFELPPEADGCSAVATQPRHHPSEPTRLAAARDNVIHLTSGGAMAGVVVDEQGRPVENYLLAIESFVSSHDSKARPSRGARQVEDPAGAFLLEELAPGRYVLTASAEARPPARSDAIEVEPGRTTHHVRIVLSRGAILSGTVIDAATRAPIAGAHVELDAATSSGANAIPRAVTDAAGGFALEGVPARGPFSVRARHPSYVTRIVPGLDPRGALSMRSDIELRPLGDGGANQELTGIGATLLPSREGGVTIAALVEGGPAERAGLEKGDRIVRVDGADATGMTMADCVQRLRGLEGTRVSVGVERDGQRIEVTITREVVVVR
jgi:protocatechuate 3,4-dioxygenase beta subunit